MMAIVSYHRDKESSNSGHEKSFHASHTIKQFDTISPANDKNVNR